MAAGATALGAAGGPIGLGITGGLIGLQSIVSLISGHKQAVQNEAQLLNIAVPTYAANLQAIFQSLQAGAITEQQAIEAIDKSTADYYAGVSGAARGTIRGRGSINTSTCTPGPKVDPCNAACVIGYQWVEVWGCNAKRIIASGGDYVGSPIPANGAISSQPGIHLHYDKPLLGSVPTIGGVPLTGKVQKNSLIALSGLLGVGAIALVMTRK